jgi:hypothetical protein
MRQCFSALYTWWHTKMGYILTFHVKLNHVSVGHWGDETGLNKISLLLSLVVSVQKLLDSECRCTPTYTSAGKYCIHLECLVNTAYLPLKSTSEVLMSTILEWLKLCDWTLWRHLPWHHLPTKFYTKITSWFKGWWGQTDWELILFSFRKESRPKCRVSGC